MSRALIHIYANCTVCAYIPDAPLEMRRRGSRRRKLEKARSLAVLSFSRYRPMLASRILDAGAMLSRRRTRDRDESEGSLSRWIAGRQFGENSAGHGNKNARRAVPCVGDERRAMAVAVWMAIGSERGSRRVGVLPPFQGLRRLLPRTGGSLAPRSGTSSPPATCGDPFGADTAYGVWGSSTPTSRSLRSLSPFLARCIRTLCPSCSLCFRLRSLSPRSRA